MAAACMLFVLLLSSTVAGLTCNDTPGVTMTARHYNFDLEQVPACIMHCDKLNCVWPQLPQILHVHAALTRWSLLSLQMPDWSDKACVDAEETKTVTDANWPVSASGDFVITLDGTDYDSNVGVVFEVSPIKHGHGATLMMSTTARTAARTGCHHPRSSGGIICAGVL